MFTGTLIEDLIATVERAEQQAQRTQIEIAKVEPWFASVQENANYDSETSRSGINS